MLKMHANDLEEFGDQPPAAVEGGIIKDDNIDDGLDSNFDDKSSYGSEFSDETMKEMDETKVA